jgi:hypothetical protein
VSSTLLQTDGAIVPVTPTNGKFFTLEEQQELVGGNIQHIYLQENGSWTVLVINEEGKFEGLPANSRATRIARKAGIADADFIVGDMLVCTDKEADGDPNG